MARCKGLEKARGGTERRKDVEVVVVLVDEREVGALGS